MSTGAIEFEGSGQIEGSSRSGFEGTDIADFGGMGGALWISQ